MNNSNNEINKVNDYDKPSYSYPILLLLMVILMMFINFDKLYDVYVSKKSQMVVTSSNQEVKEEVKISSVKEKEQTVYFVKIGDK
jgi:hypothetical protein